MICDIFYVTRTVWTVGQAEGRGVDLPNMASMKKAPTEAGALW
jgi:hypothetical protein